MTQRSIRLSRLALALLVPGSLALAAPSAQKVQTNSIQVNPVGGLAVTGLTLIDAHTNRPVPGYDPIPAGAVLDLATLPAKLNVRANTAGAAGSIRFALDGNAGYHLENGAPYALCSDNAGAYFACPAKVFAPGQHRLAATPTSGMNGGGTPGQGAAVDFSVVRSQAARPAVTSLTLIDADTDRPVPGYDPIPAGAVLRLSALPRHLNLRANTAPGVGSVRFKLDARASLENQAPFALCSDTKNKGGKKGAYFACGAGVFAPGQHTLTATPYPQMFGRGTPGQALSWTFTAQR